MYRSSEYSTWMAAKLRCSNPRDPKWHIYGGKGIRMCERWKNDFSAFLEDMGRRPPGMTLERINGSGNYEPGNCRWASAIVQANNRSGNRHIIVRGRRMTIGEAAREFGINYQTLYMRLARGAHPDRAVRR